ncbi:unnamed protein product, partial [marine sediment metagenome]
EQQREGKTKKEEKDKLKDYVAKKDVTVISKPFDTKLIKKEVSNGENASGFKDIDS